MNHFDALVTRIITQLTRVRGTLESLTVHVGPYYYQLASFDQQGQLLIEVVSNTFLPDALQLDASAEDRLSALGLLPPDDVLPNWSIRMDNATDAQISAAAHTVATALTEVYRVPPPRTHALLRDVEDGKGNRFHLEARLGGNGSLELAAHDIGPITSSVSDDGDYEYWQTIAAEYVDDFSAWLGGQPGDDVIDLVDRQWEVVPSSVELRWRSGEHQAALTS